MITELPSISLITPSYNQASERRGVRLAFLLYRQNQNHFPPQMTQMATDEEQEMMEFLLYP